MGIQQSIKINDQIESDQTKTCMSIIWVKNAENELDKMRLIQSLNKMTGVDDARFTREKPAILMVAYRKNLTSSSDVVKNISGLGIFARIVGC